MASTSLSLHSSARFLRSFASRRVTPRSTQCCRAQHSSRSVRVPSSLKVGLGILASCAVPVSGTSLCADENEGGAGDGDGDDALLSRLKSSLQSRSFPDLPHSDLLDALARHVGGQAALVLASGIPAADLSYGFCAGFFSGLALKKIGKATSLVLGAGFLALQTLAYHGYIEVSR